MALKRSSPIVLRKEFFINRISSTLYSLTSINCVDTVRGVADCRHLTDGRTDERTDGRTSSVRATGVKTSLHQKIKQTKCVSRNMFTEIRCEICINHFVEIIFTLSCAVVDVNLLQINCSQNFLLKMCKKIVQTSIGRYK